MAACKDRPTCTAEQTADRSEALQIKIESVTSLRTGDEQENEQQRAIQAPPEPVQPTNPVQIKIERSTSEPATISAEASVPASPVRVKMEKGADSKPQKAQEQSVEPTVSEQENDAPTAAQVKMEMASKTTEKTAEPVVEAVTPTAPPPKPRNPLIQIRRDLFEPVVGPRTEDRNISEQAETAGPLVAENLIKDRNQSDANNSKSVKLQTSDRRQSRSQAFDAIKGKNMPEVAPSLPESAPSLPEVDTSLPESAPGLPQSAPSKVEILTNVPEPSRSGHEKAIQDESPNNQEIQSLVTLSGMEIFKAKKCSVCSGQFTNCWSKKADFIPVFKLHLKKCHPDLIPTCFSTTCKREFETTNGLKAHLRQTHFVAFDEEKHLLKIVWKQKAATNTPAKKAAVGTPVKKTRLPQLTQEQERILRDVKLKVKCSVKLTRSLVADMIARQTLAKAKQAVASSATSSTTPSSEAITTTPRKSSRRGKKPSGISASSEGGSMRSNEAGQKSTMHTSDNDELTAIREALGVESGEQPNDSSEVPNSGRSQRLKTRKCGKCDECLRVEDCGKCNACQKNKPGTLCAQRTCSFFFGVKQEMVRRDYSQNGSLQGNSASSSESADKCGVCPGCMRYTNCGKCSGCKQRGSKKICKLRKCCQVPSQEKPSADPVTVTSQHEKPVPVVPLEEEESLEVEFEDLFPATTVAPSAIASVKKEVVDQPSEAAAAKPTTKGEVVVKKERRSTGASSEEGSDEDTNIDYIYDNLADLVEEGDMDTIRAALEEESKKQKRRKGATITAKAAGTKGKKVYTFYTLLLISGKLVVHNINSSL